jgi:hypothetical protein
MKFFVFYVLVPIYAQTDYPKDYFGSPLDIPMQLGILGIKTNHFHGFDLKTQQKEG